MRQPDGYEAGAIKRWDTERQTARGSWEPARPEPSNIIYPWYWRLLLAWDVVRGKADALYWDESVPGRKRND